MSEEHDISFDEAWDLEVGGAATDSNDTDTSKQVDTNNTGTNATENTHDQDTTSTTHSLEAEEDGAVSPNTIEEAVAQTKVWEQRFKSIEGRFQAEIERRKLDELERQKQFVEALSNTGNGSKRQEAAEDTRPSKFQELAKDFPEIAEAVEELLTQRLKGTEDFVKRAVDEKIMPLASDMSQQKVSSHLERILSKHPDAINLRKNGNLDAWINTLPVFAQHGAKYVVASGSSEDVVALLDQYKDYVKSKSTNNNQNTDKSTNDQGGRSSSQGMVDAIKAGLAVKSGRSADPKTDIKKSSKDDFDAGWEDAIRKLGAH